MFLLGLIVGPVLGLLAGDLLTGPSPADRRLSVTVVVLVALVVLFLPFIDLELRFGLVGGGLLGITLSATPDSLAPVE